MVFLFSIIPSIILEPQQHTNLFRTTASVLISSPLSFDAIVFANSFSKENFRMLRSSSRTFKRLIYERRQYIKIRIRCLPIPMHILRIKRRRLKHAITVNARRWGASVPRPCKIFLQSANESLFHLQWDTNGQNLIT